MTSLRFPEFEDGGESEEKKAREIANFSKGKSVSKKDIVIDGKKLGIRYGELYTDYGEVIDKVISKTDLPKDELVISEGNGVIIPSSGETQIDIARRVLCITQRNCIRRRFEYYKSKINGVFLSYYLNGSKKTTIAQMSQGVSVMHLYNSQLKDLKIGNSKKPQRAREDSGLFIFFR